MPVARDHPLFTEGRASIFVDPHTWIDYLSKFDFAFGNRIHGNIAALLAGVPSVVLAFDSRLKELSEYHSIPTIPIGDLTATTTAEALFSQADFESFNQRQRENVRTYSRFLAKNNLSHGFDDVTAGETFRSQFGGVVFPRGVHPMTSENATEELSRRIQWLQGEVRSKKSSLELRGHLPNWSPQQKVNVREIDAGWKVEQLAKQLGDLSRRITTLEAASEEEHVVETPVAPASRGKLLCRELIRCVEAAGSLGARKLRAARRFMRRGKNPLDR